MSSLFDGLYIARSGVRASRVALNITGQNITNANTEGYTRQRVDQSSLPPAESGGQWASIGSSVGCGANVDSIQQLRDAFLDFEFRSQNAKSGESSTQVGTLYDMEDIFTTTTTADSSSKSSVIDVLNNEFSNMLSELQSLTANNGNVSESDVRDAVSALATKLNSAAKALETTRDQQFTNLSKYGVDDANTKLQSIASLNKQIKDAEMSGSSVLELEDQRNLLLDQLSKSVSISVQETPTTLANGKTVNTMSVYLADQDGNPLTYSVSGTDKENFALIGGEDGSDYAKFTMQPSGSLATGQKVQIFLSRLSSDGAASGFQYDSGSLISSINSNLSSIVSYTNTIAAKTAHRDGIAAHMPDPELDPSGYTAALNDIAADNTAITDATSARSARYSDLTSESSYINGFTVNQAAGTATLSIGGHNYSLLAGGNVCGSFSAAQDPASGDVHLNVKPVDEATVAVPDADVYLTKDANSEMESGTFSGYLKLLNESGEYDTAAGKATTTFRGIGYYQKYLDTLAQSLASTMNTLNYNAAKKDSHGADVPVGDQLLLSGSKEKPADGLSGDDAIADIAKGVTAKNIHVAAAWANNGVLTTTKDVSPSKDNNSASFSNILNMIGKLTTDKPTLTTSAGIMVFTGSMQAAFANVSNTLAHGANSLQDTDNANSNKVSNIDGSRQQLSSVSLDDEAVSIVQFSQSLNASSRFMTAVDECLQTVINNMGMAGRG